MNTDRKIAVFVGLDYHQDSVQVAVMNQAGELLGNQRCANDTEKIRAYAESLGCVVRAGIEACCGAANLAEELADGMGWHVDLAHPGYVAQMKQNPDKSDFTDALSTEGRWIIDRHLERLVYLEQQIATVEEHLSGMTVDDALVERLRAFRGIGPVTAWTMRAEIGRFDRFRSGKQLSRFCGLSPRNASSGRAFIEAAGFPGAPGRELSSYQGHSMPSSVRAG